MCILYSFQRYTVSMSDIKVCLMKSIWINITISNNKIWNAVFFFFERPQLQKKTVIYCCHRVVLSSQQQGCSTLEIFTLGLNAFVSTLCSTVGS